ncbi:hypothetical protein CPAR01_13116 [Colletotrichum paranaense]|uniref:Uncharacterized protein n=1 Tax=Colletotrichum paranaense TaxID=1914294 RepID=A0ABQ9S525_9PEZI|nr:uncharacterized protein CPAR01_13116 [Colletotrichum paranaense]KAK1526588.1 hypothetical protein CPAR01_13116 [Colletotrichum paranaense]
MGAKRLTGQDPEIRLIEAESFTKFHPSRQPQRRRFVALSEAASVSLQYSELATMVSRHRVSLTTLDQQYSALEGAKPTVTMALHRNGKSFSNLICLAG